MNEHAVNAYVMPVHLLLNDKEVWDAVQLTFQHMLPNFNECWWDSWVLDVALCNWIGIAAGMCTVVLCRARTLAGKRGNKVEAVDLPTGLGMI